MRLKSGHIWHHVVEVFFNSTFTKRMSQVFEMDGEAMQDFLIYLVKGFQIDWVAYALLLQQLSFFLLPILTVINLMGS